MEFLTISKKSLSVAVLLCMAGALIMPGLAGALCALQPEAGEQNIHF